MKKDDVIYIGHITTSLKKITGYTTDQDINSFLQSELIQDAVIRQLEIIGEVAKRVSKELKETNPDIPWADITGMRDKLIHDYIDVDIWVVWETAKNDVPELIALFNKMKPLL